MQVNVHNFFEYNIIALYPTYDVDQSYRKGSILDIALLPGPVVRLRHHTCIAITTVGIQTS